LGEANIKDRTEAWYEHRKNGLGASSAAIVCGLSPYKPTKMQLFYEKIGTMEPDRTMSAPAFHGIHQEDYVANVCGSLLRWNRGRVYGAV
jgi:predicted phage-related endonuclease